MRRVKWLVLLGVVLLLGACSKTPKEEFIAAYDSLNSEEYNAIKFKASITDFQTNQTTGAAWANMMAESLKNMSISGDYQYNAENESYKLDADVKAFETAMPVEMVGKGEKTYLSTSFVDGMLALMDSFGSPSEVDEAQLAELKGKYLEIDLEELEAATDETAASDEKAPDPEKLNSSINKLMNKAKEDTFKSDGDTVTHTFTNKDTKKLIKEFDYGDGTMAEVESVTLTMKINKKTKKTDLTLKMQDSEQKMAMKIELTPSKKKVKVSMPKEKDVVPEEVMEELFASQSLSGVSGETTWEDEGVGELSDEEFELLYQQFEANLSAFDETHREALLSTYQLYLTDEQYARLEALFNQESVQPAV